MDMIHHVLVTLGGLFLVLLPWFLITLRKKIKVEGLYAASLRQCEQLEQRLTDTQNKIVQSEQALNANNLERVSLTQQLQYKSEQLQKLESEYTTQTSQLQSLVEQNQQLSNRLAKLQTEHEQTQKHNAEKLALLEDAKAKLALEFKALANQIFEEKQQRMTRSSKETLDSIIKPMQKDISEFKQRMEQVHKEDIEARSALSQHLSQLKELNLQMSQDALNLTKALKSDSKVQGNWGEMILENILENSGLREGVEFDREKSFTDDEGKRLRPDVIINMPGKKHVIIDAKVSLTDYERAMSATEKADKEAAIKAHVKSLQKHIQELSAKDYQHIHNINSPDYVLMFVPIEGAYLMAIEADSSIFESAFTKNIAVVTPSTLYATLKLIEQLWRYEKQSSNVAKLTKQAGSLHDKFVTFIKSFEDIETHLGRAQKSYDTALGQLKDGRGNLVNQVKTLADLSGKAKKEIPEHLLDDNEPNLPLND